jgi:hypothetical protein
VTPGGVGRRPAASSIAHQQAKYSKFLWEAYSELLDGRQWTAYSPNARIFFSTFTDCYSAFFFFFESISVRLEVQNLM